MSISTSMQSALPGLSAREACMDAVYRFVESIDTGSAELFDSAWSDDAVMDLRPLSALGIDVGVLEGKAAIRASMIGRTSTLDTQHIVSNFRIVLGDGEATTAKLTAYAQAQHKRPGEGSDGAKDGALMGNKYLVDLVRVREGLWVITKFVLHNMWFQGDASVFAAMPPV